MQYDALIVVVLVNNGMYGTIWMHQEVRHPERTTGTGLVNPRFDLLARAYGCHAESLTETELFPATFERAVASGTPALIELRTDPELISSRATIGMLRERARSTP